MSEEQSVSEYLDKKVIDASMTYYIEAMRTMILINGAAAIATLTFAGHFIEKGAFLNTYLGLGLTIFALGTFFGMISYLAGSYTQGLYRNAINTDNPWPEEANLIAKIAYVLAGMGASCFPTGLILAAMGIKLF